MAVSPSPRPGYAASMPTILVVGPDAVARTVLRDKLEAKGLDVVEAISDDEAWEIFQAGGIDLVLIADVGAGDVGVRVQ